MGASLDGVIGETLMRPDMLYVVIRLLRDTPIASWRKRQLLGRWAREVGATLRADHFEALRGGPEKG